MLFDSSTVCFKLKQPAICGFSSDKAVRRSAVVSNVLTLFGVACLRPQNLIPFRSPLYISCKFLPYPFH